MGQALVARLVVEILGIVLERKVARDGRSGYTKRVEDLSHPAAVTADEIVVHSDQMTTLVGERIQIQGGRRDEGLALAGFHFRNLALVQNDATQQLHVV